MAQKEQPSCITRGAFKTPFPTFLLLPCQGKSRGVGTKILPSGGEGSAFGDPTPPLTLLFRHPTTMPLNPIWSQEPREGEEKKTTIKEG